MSRQEQGYVLGYAHLFGVVVVATTLKQHSGFDMASDQRPKAAAVDGIVPTSEVEGVGEGDTPNTGEGVGEDEDADEGDTLITAPMKLKRSAKGSKGPRNS